MERRLYKRFWLLYFAALGIGVDQFIDKLDELAEQIDQKNPQAEEALTFYEDNFLKIVLNGEENIYPPMLGHEMN
jgi:hypothetical protein